MTRARVVPEIEKYGFLALIGAFALFLILTFIGRDRTVAEALRPGEAPRVRAPSAGHAIAAAPAPSERRGALAPGDAPTWTVKRGETLASIARDALGNAANWKQIVAENPGLDAKRLRPGQVLNLPRSRPKVASAKAVVPVSRPGSSGGIGLKPATRTERRHSVAVGESLRTIATRYYRDPSRWKDILAANHEAIEDPDRLIPGLVVVIP